MATLQQDRMFFEMFYGESSCMQEFDATIEEIEETIEECKAMLEYSIDHGNKNEIYYWRKLLQENKMCRRKMLIA